MANLRRATDRTVSTTVVVAADLFQAECVACALCSQVRGLAIEGVASVAAARSEVVTWAADLFLLDLSCVEGLEMCALIRSAAPGAAVVAYRVPVQLDHVVRWEYVDVDARVGVDSSINDLAAAVEAVLDGAESIRGESARAPSLTKRELDILRLVAEGRSNAEIAQALHLQRSTVKNHVHSILVKLDAHSRGEAAARYREASFAFAPQYGAS